MKKVVTQHFKVNVKLETNMSQNLLIIEPPPPPHFLHPNPHTYAYP